MKDFILIAKDALDEGAYDRRMKARPEHLQGIEQMRAKGHALYGAALLNAEEKPIGSAMAMRFESRAAFDAWLKTEPFVVNKVWADITVHEAKLAPPYVDLIKEKA